MPSIASDSKAYQRLINTFKRYSSGVSTADLVSYSGLPLETVKELLPKASDEFGARLKVTESGEILYSFPHGLKSRYRGFIPSLKRASRHLIRGLAALGKVVFKLWIAVMLVGYFIFFIGLALLALTASMAVSVSSSGTNRSSQRRGSSGLGGFYLASRVLNFIIRIWFYSELTKPLDRQYGRPKPSKQRRPLHLAVYSFVFGDGDPNIEWASRERKAIIAYIQANKGVIALPEFIMLTGLTPEKAELALHSFLADFKGSPEVTNEGSLVYRFDELMRRSDRADRSFSSLSAPLKRPFKFSINPANMNRWFMVFNAVNLFFGSYFLYFALKVGPIFMKAQISAASQFYAFTYALFSQLANPVALIAIALGVVPLSFAALFYLVPVIRKILEKRKNQAIETENARKDITGRIWANPSAIRLANSDRQTLEETLIKELATYAIPELSYTDDGKLEYQFPSLATEKQALEQYRASQTDFQLGDTIFDSHG